MFYTSFCIAVVIAIILLLVRPRLFKMGKKRSAGGTATAVIVLIAILTLILPMIFLAFGLRINWFAS